MDNDAARLWNGLLRDLVCVFLSSFMLIHETVGDSSPDSIIVGAALTLMGVPAAVRFDNRRRDKNGYNDDTQR